MPKWLSGKLAVPTLIATLVGIGVDIVGNSLDHIWSSAPYWMWLTIFLLGLLMTAAFPLWLFWTFGVLALRRLLPDIPIAFEVSAAKPNVSFKYPWVDLEAKPDEGHVQIFSFGDVLFTNTSDEPVTLIVHLRITGMDDKTNIHLPASTKGPWGRIYGVNDNGTLGNKKRGLPIPQYFNNPLSIGPWQTIERRLDFIFDAGFDQMRKEIAKHVVENRYNYALEVTDHISGVTLNQPLPVKYRGR